jgi:hypothetical protein
MKKRKKKTIMCFRNIGNKRTENIHVLLMELEVTAL